MMIRYSLFTYRLLTLGTEGLIATGALDLEPVALVDEAECALSKMKT